MKRAAILLLPASATLTSPASPADAVAAQHDAATLSASPDAPVSTVAWRRQLRGKVALVVPVIDDAGFSLRLPAFVELHNERPSFVPYQHWRGRIAVEAGVHRRVADGALSLVLALEHESDHSSVPSPWGFLNLNDAAARVVYTRTAGDSAVTFALTPKLHLLTCTVDPRTCDAGGGRAGSVTFEQAGEVVVDVGLGEARPRLFLASAFAWLVANGEAAEERRLTMDAGVWTKTQSRGGFQLFVTSLVGHDVGFYRNLRRPPELGLGLRWAPP